MEIEYSKPLVSGKESSSNCCDVCKVNEDGSDDHIPPATTHCVECHENLCDECTWHHKRQKLSRLHTVVPFSTNNHYNKDCKSSICDTHHKVQEMYCVECQLSICMGCFEESHQLHKCTTIKKAADEFKYRIESELENVAEILSYDASMTRRIEENERNLIEKLKTLQDEIFNRGAELKDIVDQHTDHLSKELVLISEYRLKQIKGAREELETHQLKINEFYTSCNDVLGQRSAGNICRAADHILDQARQIKRLRETCSLTENIPQPKLSLNKAHLEDFLSLNNVIGTIAGVSCSSIRLNARLDTAQRPACGVAKSHKKIFVLCHSPSSILIFQNGEPFLLQNEIKMDAIQKPCDIVASEKSKCLYISDGETRCVWRVEKDLTVVRWLTGIGESSTLSLTLDDRLITVRKYQPANLELYGPHVSTTKKILQLPRYITSPCHAVETSPGRFLLCCGGWNSEAASQLYEFTEIGQSIRQLHWGSVTDLGIPRHLSADRSNGRMFVADSWGSRVLLLDLASESCKELLTENRKEVRSPWRLCYDSEKRNLIVMNGNRTSGTIDLYSLDPA